MASTRTRSDKGMAEIAAWGALAGAAGGIAVAVLEREVLSRVAGGAPHRAEWDDRAARVLRRTGLPVRGRGTVAAGVGSQVIYAAALGAAYAVLREETSESRAGRMMLDGAMAYAASLVFPDIPQPKRRAGARAVQKKLVSPANPAATYGRVTSMALGFLLR